MSQSFITKALSFGFAAMITLSITSGLDALASTEQSAAKMAGRTITQTACVDPTRAAGS